MPAYAEASCAAGSSLHAVAASVEHDAAQQERTVITIYRANPSFPQQIIAKALFFSAKMTALVPNRRELGQSSKHSTERQIERGSEGS